MSRKADREAEIARYRAEMDWERASDREGRRHGVVISVRLDARDADRLREQAARLGLTLSEVVRRAINNQSGPKPPRSLGVWTSNRGATILHDPIEPHVSWKQASFLEPLTRPETSTEGARIHELVG